VYPTTTSISSGSGFFPAGSTLKLTRENRSVVWVLTLEMLTSWGGSKNHSTFSGGSVQYTRMLPGVCSTGNPDSLGNRFIHVENSSVLAGAAFSYRYRTDPFDLDRLSRALIASDLVREREAVLAGLRRLGVQCIDGLPGAVTTQLVNRYLDLKRREMM